jgi:lysophospholipase
VFVDPDPQGLDKVEGFLGENKFRFIGALAGLVVFLGLLIGLL